MLRGFRGATTVTKNDADLMLSATKELLWDMTDKNKIAPQQIASVLISVTNDLNATFPAKALRMLDGWKYVPVMCTNEIPVPDALPNCIRVMLLAETDLAQEEVQHIYHHEAKRLRPDLAK
ncbi:chorismate mutase [Salirhabdus sp. Marseille-P4669]|uniref:chorismate mutase n=1 Tax=Salirhabdus sp. Marseille-P4669 TaxID=2042310 RepID=UPI000C7AEFA5|nr:chorismate mutase [Salirhabdus sp. Marseille-P4669]